MNIKKLLSQLNLISTNDTFLEEKNNISKIEEKSFEYNSFDEREEGLFSYNSDSWNKKLIIKIDIVIIISIIFQINILLMRKLL